MAGSGLYEDLSGGLEEAKRGKGKGERGDLDRILGLTEYHSEICNRHPLRDLLRYPLSPFPFPLSPFAHSPLR
jgi:hypothetical protein